MKFSSLIVPAGLTALSAVALAQTYSTPTATPTATPSSSSGTSDYIFRFNAGVSSVLGGSLNFNSANQQSLNLGQCTTTLMVDGAVGCANNCQSQMVCLLIFTGPAGLASTDILEKVDETPSTGASPTPSSGVGTMPVMDVGSKFAGTAKYFRR